MQCPLLMSITILSRMYNLPSSMPSRFILQCTCTSLLQPYSHAWHVIGSLCNDQGIRLSVLQLTSWKYQNA